MIIIPLQFCDNAGFDATIVLNKLRQKHELPSGEGAAYGVDVNTGGIADSLPTLFGSQQLSMYLRCRGLVSQNFLQEKKVADFHYGLVRVRENAESIAFYGGEEKELQLLLQRFRNAFENLSVLACLRSLIRKCAHQNLTGSDLLKLFPSDLSLELQSTLVLLLRKCQSQWKEEVSREKKVS
ncbi:hypothetical protein ACFE04_029179 [Oxalis oulophora]